MKSINSSKSIITIAVFGALFASTGLKAATTDTAYLNTSPSTNIVIGITGQDESAKIYNLDQIDNNTTAINNEAASRQSADQDLQTQINNNKTDQEQVNHALLSHDINQEKQITGNTTRIDALENAPKPKDGVDGKQGLQGVKGDTGATGKTGIDGKNGVTTTITKVDTATQKKVDNQGKQILSTSKAVFDNHQAVSKMNNSFASLKDQVDDNHKQANAGISGAMAMSNIPQVMNNQTFAIGAGIGGYDGENAVAVGASARLGDSVVVKATVSDDTADNVGYGAGLSVGW
ncbi:YadA-like family protein [Escherichia coli]